MKKLTALFAGALMMVGISGIANAATCELNIFGASAQYTFWKAAAQQWLLDTSALGAKCASVDSSRTCSDTAGKNGVATGTGCNPAGAPSCTEIIVRFSSKNSCAGLQAVTGSAADGCADPRQRQMANETTCSGGILSGLTCKTVTDGCSDVEASSLVQATAGQKYGPLGGSYQTPGPCGVTIPGTYSVHKSFVVPFGFFANTAVTQSRCVGGTRDDEKCTNSSHCPGGTCTPGLQLKDLSRLEAILIFTGQLWNWSDLGPSFVNLPMEVCHRHSGSGTLATLVNAVLHPAWGGNLPGFESKGCGGDATIWFNDGSSDMMKCINGAGTAANNCDGVARSDGHGGYGRIGYADADQGNLTFTYGPIKYNGYKPYRHNIREGLYDNFWSYQTCYDNIPAGTGAKVIDQLLFDWSKTNVPTAKAEWWTPPCEMIVKKDSDRTYPYYTTPTCTPPEP
ncbi:MAG: substrate-binding domain-containing protein [Syntrophaceae bacterium]|nr:substrate-binding domain-containing protein [Syntrophaceae bacterium]